MSAVGLAACVAFALASMGAFFPAAATPADSTQALLDSLAAWHQASDTDQVERIAHPAIAAARAAHDATALRALLLARGRTRAAFGLALQAEPDLREVLAMAEAARDTPGTLEALRWLGVSVGNQGRAAEAIGIFRRLAAMAMAAADSQQLGWAWVGIAFDHYQAGRPGSAGPRYGRAAGVLERAGVPKGAAWAWSGRGLAQRQQGDYAGARASHERALALARAGNDAFNEAAALNYMGRLELQVGDPGQAAAMLERALKLHRRHQAHREGTLAAIDVAAARALQGRLDAAAAVLDSVRADCRSTGLLDLELLATSELAEVRIQQERPSAAARLCRQALARGEFPSAMIGTELRLCLARALAQRDSLAAALGVLDAAVAAGAGSTSLALELAADRGALLLSAGRADQALAELGPALRLARSAGADQERVVPLLTGLARAHLALGEPDSALSLFARAARSWEAARGLPADPEWRELRSAAAAELFSRGTAAMLEHPTAAPTSQRLSDAFAFAQRYKARTLLERLQGPGAPVSAAPPLAAGPPAAALQAGEVLLDVVQGGEIAVIFCVTPDTMLAAVVPGARACAPWLRRLEEILASDAARDASALRGPALELAAALPRGIRDELARARRLLWSPDGNLHRLPLSLVANAEGERLLPEGCEIARLPAVGLLQRNRASTVRPGSPARLLAVSGRDTLGNAPLPGVAAEVRWLAASLRDVDRLAVGQDGAWDSAAWRQADIVHVASHIRVDAQQPWNSVIPIGAGARGELRARDIAELRLHASLAVLTGCRTAGSRVIEGEGFLGLATAFVAAGTPAVVATLWPVDDHVAARFTTCFFQALLEGQPAGAALVQARAQLRGRTETASARHWAAFVLVGDPGVQVPVRARRRMWPTAAVLAALAAATALGASRLTDRRALKS